MAKRNPQPAKDAGLRKEVKQAAKKTETTAKTGDVATAKKPADTAHFRDNRDETGVIGH
jgi:hypothetical protein